MKFRSTALRGLAGSVSVAALMIAGPLAAQEQDATGAPEASGPIDDFAVAGRRDGMLSARARPSPPDARNLHRFR